MGENLSRKTAKKEQTFDDFGWFFKNLEKNGDSGDKMVTAVTGIFNRDKIPENPVFMRVCSTLMNIVENNTWNRGVTNVTKMT